MSYLDIWYESFGGREQSEHAESIELWGRSWSIGDKVFSLYNGWGEIKTLWRYPLGNQRERAWMCHTSFLSGNFEVERLSSLNTWMTEASFASDRGEKAKPKSVTQRQPRSTALESVTQRQPRFTAPESVTRTDDEIRGVIRCVICNAEMNVLAKRRHTKTCSSKCRKALSRKERAI